MAISLQGVLRVLFKMLSCLNAPEGLFSQINLIHLQEIV